MTKSSEVLRLAAEYALSGEFGPIGLAKYKLGAYANQASTYAQTVGYFGMVRREHRCIALCLAAAIAESEGD